jgi:hypothetical protein
LFFSKKKNSFELNYASYQIYIKIKIYIIDKEKDTVILNLNSYYNGVNYKNDL